MEATSCKPAFFLSSSQVNNILENHSKFTSGIQRLCPLESCSLQFSISNSRPLAESYSPLLSMTMLWQVKQCCIEEVNST